MYFLIKLAFILGVILGFGLLIMYNQRIIKFLSTSKGKSETLFYKLIGRHMSRWHKRIDRSVNLKKGTKRYKIYTFFQDIIVNLGMSRYHVTPLGFLTFIVCMSLSLAILTVVLFKEASLFVLSFGSFIFFFIILFRFLSLTMYEKREARIMDSVDLLSMDVKGGVYNAIVRYKNSLHPSIRPYFEEFVNNIQFEGYSFKEAMLNLNDKLGSEFTDFAHKAIIYEEKADEDLEEIFSTIVETNRNKRTLRYLNNEKFSQLRFEFILSNLIIAGYGMFTIWTDPFMRNFFTNTTFGKVLLILDLVLVTLVLAYISSIKSKSL